MKPTYDRRHYAMLNLIPSFDDFTNQMMITTNNLV